jgi:hypothetical protein
MNKKALSEYALFARKELENQIRLSLNRLGVFEDSIKTANVVGDFTIVEGTQETFPKRVYGLRNSIIDGHIREKGFNNVVEEFAYTWFNRIVAIRFLEVHDYFPHGFRVLTSRDGSYEPEILDNLPFVKDELKLDMAVVESLKSQNKIEDLYRYVLFKQCNALSTILPMLFDEQESYLELLLPANLLSEGSVIRKITDIPEEDFKNDVEVIGWLYQFYNSVKKNEVFASKETITKETLPAVTQLFTPDWIVRYLAQNSIGRIWIESYPDSPLKKEMNYYSCLDQKESENVEPLKLHKNPAIDPQNIKVIEPCCGSGHILVYAFDLLFKMYLEKGYTPKDIPGLILAKNLFGLDVDKRAAQLSQFALLMKARSVDNHFFSKDRIVFPKVFEIEDSTILIQLDYRKMIAEFGFSEGAQSTIEYLVDAFRNGKVIGSLLKIRLGDYQGVINEIKDIEKNFIPDLLESAFFETGLPVLELLCEDAILLSSRYDVLITNPPYCKSSSLEDDCKKYLAKNYADSKEDLFSAFMDTGFVQEDGFLAMINMHAWMFQESFFSIRDKVIRNKQIITMAHLGPRAFDEIGGEVVQTTSFVLRNAKPGIAPGVFFRLVAFNGQDQKETAFFDKTNRFVTFQGSFLHIPSEPIAYWCSPNGLKAFENPLLKTIADLSEGIHSRNNDFFVRNWYEIDPSQFSGLSASKEWVPLNKGGESREWYGNNYFAIRWGEDGTLLKKDPHATLGFTKKLFSQGITFTCITSKKLTFRYSPSGYLYDVTGPTIFPKDERNLYYLLGLLNSNVLSLLIRTLNQTMYIRLADLNNIPVIENHVEEISTLSEENVNLAKDYWDSFETSWEFKKHPLLGGGLISDRIAALRAEQTNCREKMAKNETRINELLIQSYGLSGEVSARVSETEVCVQPLSDLDWIKSLLSYLVGILVGRYSLDKDGVIFNSNAEKELGKENDVAWAPDGLLPIYKFENIDDGISNKICYLLKKIFGEQTYSENVLFIAKVLGAKADQSPEESINSYFEKDFFDDHLKAYQKRPIYWMFSSGKNGAFKCLMYVHRYDKNFLARVNTKYFLKRIELYKSEHTRLEGKLRMPDLSVKEKKDLEGELATVKDCENEMFEYGQILDHLANQYIEISLDDGVKANYQKFQDNNLIIDGTTVTRDLFVPVKSFEDAEK